MMSHVPADVRCALCVADMSESIYHLGLQLSAAFHRLQAAVAARRGGRGVRRELSTFDISDFKI